MVMKINIPRWGGYFSIPISVAEKYLKLSSAEQLKVLLFVLSKGEFNIDCSYVADALSVSDDAVEEALQYWHSLGVLTIEGSTAADVTKPAEITCAKPTVSAAKVDDKKRVVIKYRPSDIEKLAKNDSEIRTLFEQVQKTLCRTINASEQASLINFYEYYGFPVATIIMLCEYCHSDGKDNFKYIESVAKDWHQNGIIEPKDAELEIIRLTEYYTYEAEIKRALGLTSKTTKSQKSYFEKWRKLSFPVDLVDYAGEISIDKTKEHTVSFEYMDTVLTSWNENGIVTVAQAQKDSSDKSAGAKKTASGKKPTKTTDKREKAGSKYADRDRERLLKLLGEE